MWTRPRTMEGVEAAFRRAIALDPRNAEAHHQYADWLNIVGRDTASMAEMRAALAIDPARAISLRNLGVSMGAAGLPLLDSAVQLDPSYAVGYGMRAQARIIAGDTAGARQDLALMNQRATEETRIYTAGSSAFLQLELGDTAAARALVRDGLARLAPSGPLGLRTMPLLGAAYAMGDVETGVRLTLRLQPRGAVLWFAVMQKGTNTSTLPPALREAMEESRPPWVR